MPDTTATRSLLSSIGYLGRDLKNNTDHARSSINDLGSSSTESREFAERTLPLNLANALRDAEAIADKIPALRAIASGQALPTKVESLGSSIVVRYAQPTNTRGAKWLATYWRDNDTTFRASNSFTYEDKDNDGADLAAAKCLAKFEEYCNGSDLDLPKVSFSLTGRTSLGNGSYAYTYKATR
jgi:hypothetical protein